MKFMDIWVLCSHYYSHSSTYMLMWLICSSSVYNHFDKILVQQLGKGSPDFVVLVQTKSISWWPTWDNWSLYDKIKLVILHFHIGFNCFTEEWDLGKHCVEWSYNYSDCDVGS